MDTHVNSIFHIKIVYISLNDLTAAAPVVGCLFIFTDRPNQVQTDMLYIPPALSGLAGEDLPLPQSPSSIPCPQRAAIR